jgi:hypothetical protein
LSALATLAYLEWRMLLHRVERVLHQPARLVMWSLFLLWILFVTVGRVMRGSYSTAVFALPHALSNAAIALFPAVYLAFMGYTMMRSTLRPPAAFAYPADARFLCGSALPPRLVGFWLQCREFIGSGQRYLFAIIAMGVGFRGAGWTLVLIVLTVTVATGLLQMLPLPTFLLARRYPHLRVGLLASAVMFLGVLAIAYPAYYAYLAWKVDGDVLTALPTHALWLPPGVWLIGTALGHWPSLIALLLTALAFAMVAAAAAADCYPELWEASVREFAQRDHVRSRFFGLRSEAPSGIGDADTAGASVRTFGSSTVARVPAGAWPIFWKDWLALSRSPEASRGAIGFMLVATLVGAVFGFLAREGGFEVLAGLGSGIAYAAIALSAQRAVALSVELRKPLWWLSSVPLFVRLAAWTLSAALRVSALVALGVVAAAAISGAYLAGVLILLLLPVFFWVGQAVGVAAYSVFPAKGDLRGPGALIRMLVSYILFVPPIGVWLVTQFVFGQSPIVAVPAACAWAVLEGAVLIWFAARRLAGDGMAFSWAELR